MESTVVPDFLTINEAARVLRIGRTTAYQQAHRCLDTGSEGLPVEWVGGSLRSPRDQFEQHYRVRITAIPGAAPRRRPKGPEAEKGGEGRNAPRPKPPRGPTNGGTTQGDLPFGG